MTNTARNKVTKWYESEDSARSAYTCSTPACDRIAQTAANEATKNRVSYVKVLTRVRFLSRTSAGDGGGGAVRASPRGRGTGRPGSGTESAGGPAAPHAGGGASGWHLHTAAPERGCAHRAARPRIR
eukprot:1189795-Prorocentrum_minimum.AAC.3